MANDGRVDKHKGRLGDELTKGRQCQRDDAAIDGSAIAVGGGRIYVHAHTHTMHCFIAQAALRTTSSYPPPCPPSYPPCVDNSVDYPQSYPPNVDNFFLYPHFSFRVLPRCLIDE